MRLAEIPIQDEIDLEVLLVCGDSALADMYRLKLEMDGYRVTSLDQLEGWQLWAGNVRPDMVVFDFTEESPSSIVDLERLRTNKAFESVPVLLLSKRRTDELAQLGLKLRPTEHLLRIAVPDLEHLVAAQSQGERFLTI